MAVTALLPVVLMPWLDVMGSKDLCSNYLKVRYTTFLSVVWTQHCFEWMII